jgi:hypothetical protein
MTAPGPLLPVLPDNFDGFRFAHGGPSIETPPPQLGADTDTVLAGSGYAVRGDCRVPSAAGHPNAAGKAARRGRAAHACGKASHTTS